MYSHQFSPKTFGPWNQLRFADSPTLDKFPFLFFSENNPLDKYCQIYYIDIGSSVMNNYITNLYAKKKLYVERYALKCNRWSIFITNYVYF